MKRYTMLLVALALTALAIVVTRHGVIAVAYPGTDNPFGTESDPYFGESNQPVGYGELPVADEPFAANAIQQRSNADALQSHAETLFRQGYISERQLRAIESQIQRENAAAQRQRTQESSESSAMYGVEMEPDAAASRPTGNAPDLAGVYQDLGQSVVSQREQVLQELDAAREAVQPAITGADEHQLFEDEQTQARQSAQLTKASANELRIIAQTLAEARQILQHANSDERKTQAKQILREALDKYFDVDMDVRRAELEKIKRRVTDMEVQLEKRASSKDQIVELQLQMFLNEAEGLGFFRARERDSLALPGVMIDRTDLDPFGRYVPPTSARN